MTRLKMFRFIRNMRKGKMMRVSLLKTLRKKREKH